MEVIGAIIIFSIFYLPLLVSIIMDLRERTIAKKGMAIFSFDYQNANQQIQIVLPDGSSLWE